ncbi:MAG: ribonuclease III [Verrucomicrobiota bacterium]|nr:ribonuclease III [Verrucomicrobiota bacterium]
MKICFPFYYVVMHVEAIEERLGYVFSNKDLLITALTHRSYLNEHREKGLAHNERLEFLGDSVLGLVVADYLYHRLPTYAEGALSQLRSKLVEAASCAKYLQKLGLAEFILLGRGENMTEGRGKTSILADTFEAIVGAIFLDGGMAIAKSFLLCHFEEEANAAIGSPPRNYKAELQDYSQKKYQQIPIYKVAEESGPDHAKLFHVIVCIADREMGLGLGSSKKEAEQRAAFDALSKLESV